MPKLLLPSGHTWAFVDANPDGRTTLLCLHGFPDLSYGYWHQIGPWARAGFRVVVPDMLGYGGSDAPVDPAQYTTKRLAADLAALLTLLGVARAVVIGHDWGSFTAGRFALWHPERVLALVLMSVPFTPAARGPVALETIAQHAPNLAYQLYLASPAAAPTIEADILYFLGLAFAPPHAPVDFTPRGALAAFLASPPSPAAAAQMPSVLTPAERALYCAAFRARGMTGPTNYYRTTHLRGAEERGSPSATSTSNPKPGALTLPPVPVLALYGTRDPTITPAALAGQRRTIPPQQLTERAMEGAGHWVLLVEESGSGSATTDAGAGKSSGSDVADPLAPWRTAVSTGAWKRESGTGGEVGRVVLEWLAGVGIQGGDKARL
ncbi:epoxide hydrolase [Mycena maculata]|uniref:Epoxide hydrolase n=1 Tax=Mycena maculata TaxID=230809 RepID=A0AAD7I4W7_9AGAR|nr:epoxide hydrolase [Mycena maculata]